MENLNGKIVYIQNIRYGYMFAADKDIKDGDHIVETRPSTKEEDKEKEKFKWQILDAPGGCYVLKNLKYDFCFSADKDIEDGDHFAECRPNSSSNLVNDKFRWQITQDHSTFDYYIKNEKYGYMFAASGDIKDGDHVVECRPNGSGNLIEDKFKWRIIVIS